MPYRLREDYTNEDVADDRPRCIGECRRCQCVIKKTRQQCKLRTCQHYPCCQFHNEAIRAARDAALEREPETPLSFPSPSPTPSPRRTPPPPSPPPPSSPPTSPPAPHLLPPGELVGRDIDLPLPEFEEPFPSAAELALQQFPLSPPRIPPRSPLRSPIRLTRPPLRVSAARQQEMIVEHVENYARTKGITLTEYNPSKHDHLLVNVVDWCRNYVSQEKITEILSQIRDPAALPHDEQRQKLHVYIAMTAVAGQPIAIGLVAIATLLPFDYLYSNVAELKTALLALPNAEYRALNIKKLTQNQLARRKNTPRLLDEIAEDDQFPTISGIDMTGDVSRVGELLVVCVNPDAPARGIGRFLVVAALNEIFTHYDLAFTELGTHNGQVNPAMRRMVEEIGFREAVASFSYPAYRIENIPWTDENGNRQYFFTYPTKPFTLPFIQRFLRVEAPAEGKYAQLHPDTPAIIALAKFRAWKRTDVHLRVPAQGREQKQQQQGEAQAVQAYDLSQYSKMNADKVKINAFQAAIRALANEDKSLKDSNWLEIGPGADAPLSLTMAEVTTPGTKHTLIEGNTLAIVKLRKHKTKFNIIHGYSTDVKVIQNAKAGNQNEPFPVLVAEILGNLALSEAWRYVVRQAKAQNLIAEDAKIIPRYCATLVAPGSLAKLKRPRGKAKVYYSERLVYTKLRPLDVSIVERNHVGVMEFFDAQAPVNPELTSIISDFDTFTSNVCDCLVLWIWADMGHGGPRRATHPYPVLRDYVTRASTWITSNSADVGHYGDNWLQCLVLLPRTIHLAPGDELLVDSQSMTQSDAIHYTLSVRVIKSSPDETDEEMSIDLPYDYVRPDYEPDRP